MINKIKNEALLFYLCLISLWSCSDKSLPTEDVMEIDMENYAIENFDNLVKDISYIRLESENVPNFGSCRRMVKFQNYLYLIVSTPNGGDLLIFDESGKFIRSLYKKDFFVPVTICTIDLENNQLLVFIGRSLLDRYTLDGTFVNRVNLPFTCGDLIAINDQEFLLYDGGGNKEWNYSLALTDLTDFRKFFLQKASSSVQSSPQSMFAWDVVTKKIFFHLNYNDTIYQYDNEKELVSPYVHLNFHGNFLSTEKIPENGFSDKEMAEIINQKRYILGLNSFYLISDHLFFKLSGKRTDICSINIKDNSLKSFEALFDNFQTSDYNPFVYSDGESLYCMVKGSALREHYKNSKCSYPAIQQYLLTLQEKEEWVLLVIEINQ